jgi:hypothetical protein
MQRFILLLIIAALGWYGYGKYQARIKAQSPVEVEAPQEAPRPETPRSLSKPEATPPLSENKDASPFKCDGRVYCSQMTSCAEATFFLKNCPGTKMDGDNNGIPCEKQWCK